MHMNSLKIKGGYGEHGRSCFMIEYVAKRYIMFDCGIMDTDPFPFPNINEDEARNTDFLFLSHAHKDHCGAVDHLVAKGFDGTILATKQTLELADIHYKKTINLKATGIGMHKQPFFTVTFGRSGHSPGSLWFLLTLNDGYKFFYSGDFQIDPLLYACDIPKDITADVAIIDMAHDQLMQRAEEMRNDILAMIKRYLTQGFKVIMPVQLYGRGNELLYLLANNFAKEKIAIDKRMMIAIEKMLKDQNWMQKDHRQEFIQSYEAIKNNDIRRADLILLADTHLEKADNQLLVEQLLSEKAIIIASGRKKGGSFVCQMLEENKAIRICYPHHSSRADALTLYDINNFKITLPFHSEIKEVWG